MSPGYVYKGTEFDAKPHTYPKRPEKPFDPTLCGSPSGVWQHRRSKQRLCATCRAADNARRHGTDGRDQKGKEVVTHGR